MGVREPENIEVTCCSCGNAFITSADSIVSKCFCGALNIVNASKKAKHPEPDWEDLKTGNKDKNWEERYNNLVDLVQSLYKEVHHEKD